jgi:hypothetical protein
MNKETEEANLENVPLVPETFQPMMEDDQFQTIIRLAQHSEELGKAFDKLRKFVLARALPGDWVRFGSDGKPGYLELSGAGSFRIASVLGISWTNWKSWKEQGTDPKGEWITWWYQCDAYFGARKIECIQGRAGSRDKFFGYTSEAGWKELSDVRETDIQVAARRNAMKEGVKVMLGLLHIPEEAAASLGLPLHVVRGHTFVSKGQPPAAASGGSEAPKGESKESAQAPAAEHQKTTITIKDVTVKSGKTGNTSWNRFCIISDNDARFTTFDANLAQTAKDAKAGGSQIEIEFTTGQYGNEVKNLRSLDNDGVAQ